MSDAQFADLVSRLFLAAVIGSFFAGIFGAGVVDLVREVYRYHWARRRSARIRRMRFGVQA